MSPAVAVKTFRRESSKGRGDRMKNSRLPTGCRETSRLTTFINATNKTQAAMKAQVILQSADAMIGFTYSLDRPPSKTAFAVAPAPRYWLFQLFHQHLGLSSALFVFLAAGGRQVLGRALGKPALGLEVSECLC